MYRPTLTDKLRYRFDNFMSKGAIALIFGLGVVAAAIVALSGLALTLFHLHQDEDDTLNFGEAAWASLMRTLDAGTMGGDTGIGFRVVMLAVTFGGIFIVSALIGVINNGIESKLEEMRKGRSRVIENEHTVILGWSDQIFPIISELVLANESRHKPCIVVLGPKDKGEMDDEIRERVGDTKNTSIICRTGSPIDPEDLSMVSVQTSRSIIALAPEDDDPDSSVIKTILAITNGPDRRKEPYHIVSELRDERNLEAARMVGGKELQLVLIGDLISRITVQTCRQSGLSVVYTELLDFGGDEIYFRAEPSLAGKTFGAALSAYETSAVMGLQLADGTTRLNPPMETVLSANDQLIIIAEDDSKIRLGNAPPPTDEGQMRRPSMRPDHHERTLILGFNWRVPGLIAQMDQYVAAGSEVTVVTDRFESGDDLQRECGTLNRLALRFQTGDTTDRRTLESLDIPSYEHVILLCSDDLELQRADAKVLIALLHVREIVDRSGKDVTIVSEMLDMRNRNLAEVTRADDFIVSGKLISLMLSQISENKDLNAVFQDMFDPEGSEIYLKPVDDFIALNTPVNFYALIESARRRGQVAIGYRKVSLKNDPKSGYGVKLNPPKSEMISFQSGDKLIVLAEN
jgi:voltage-gated potassium channel Kch